MNEVVAAVQELGELSPLLEQALGALVKVVDEVLIASLEGLVLLLRARKKRPGVARAVEELSESRLE